MDVGVENGEVERFMVHTRGKGRGSAIKGRSVHNVRREQLWVDVYKDSTAPYHHIFSSLEELGVYMYTSVDNFRHQHNNHPLRTEHNHTPLQLWVPGVMHNYNRRDPWG
ncbi:hypothetical protein LSAT2_024284 [Lamellibrachia satsuma]|nr:hypothetical protein LSAT2_024284 [Lamellibrachia satsuma]